MSLFGDFEHHLQICVGDHTPNGWVMFHWDIYQPLFYLEIEHHNTPIPPNFFLSPAVAHVSKGQRSSSPGHLGTTSKEIGDVLMTKTVSMLQKHIERVMTIGIYLL